MTPALSLTTSDLAGALRRVRFDALDAGIAAMRPQAAQSLRAVIVSGARQMLGRPDLIVRAITGQIIFAPPFAAHSPAEWLADCEASIAVQVAFGRRGDRYYDGNRLIALRQARLALRWLRRDEARRVRRMETALRREIGEAR